MHDGDVKPLERNHSDYKKNFDELPFERILEKFRLRKSIEVLSNIPVDHVDKVLEIGPGYSALSVELFPNSRMVLLEPSEDLQRHNNARFFNSTNIAVLGDDLESFFNSPNKDSFDLVILSSVFHEFINPNLELSRIHSLLSDNGQLFMVVPNNESIHRLLGVHIGVLKSSTSLTTTEQIMQQHANYSSSEITKKLEEHNFKVEFLTTNFVKPHTHLQMQQWVDDGSLTTEMLEHLYDLSKFFAPYNSEIFLLARKSHNGN